MNMSRHLGSKYLGAVDFPKPALVTIQSVDEEPVGEDQVVKPVMTFEDVERPIILNKTNLAFMVDLCGEESDDWIGKQVEIYVDNSVMYAGRRTPALRLRAPRPVQQPQQRSAPPVRERPAQQQPVEMAPFDAVTDADDSIPDPALDPPLRAHQRRPGNK